MTNTSPLSDLSKQNIHIIGISGLEANSIANYLIKSGCQNLTFHDLCPKSQLESNLSKSCSAFSKNEIQENLNLILNSGHPLYLEDQYLNKIETADLIFAPQSWDMHDNNLKLQALKPKIYNIIDLYTQVFPGTIIAITGSAGKSSVCNILYQALTKLSPNKSFLSGNTRAHKPTLYTPNFSTSDFLILEVSNRHLKNIRHLKPHIAAITNITSNHINEHGSFENYFQTKVKITKDQDSQDKLILPPEIQNIQTQAETIHYPNSPEIQGLLPHLPKFSLCNYNLAYQILQTLGFQKQEILQSLSGIQALKDRFEFIGSINQIKFYNDREGTSVNSTIQVLNYLKKETTILIFGGATKQADLEPLIAILQEKNITALAIKSPISELLSQKMTLDVFPDLTSAFKKAMIIVKTSQTPSNILFSPACEYGPYFSKLKPNKDFQDFVPLVLKELTNNKIQN